MLCLFAGGSVGREEPVDQARIGDADLLLRDASGVVEREVKNIARAVIARCIKGVDVVTRANSAERVPHNVQPSTRFNSVIGLVGSIKLLGISLFSFTLMLSALA